ncbi:hypothetical protein K502DRAFT_324164 [Neoconidiobolus thromboides FSU 785]|nr:hypothetical protein K502DRAFT_324164 [Neoconidiobolus thromboides FSU 785]
MYDYMQYCLYKYFELNDFNQENLYSNLCKSSNDILDFKIPIGINGYISGRRGEKNKLSLSGNNDMSKLKSSLGYIYTNQSLNLPKNQLIYYNTFFDKLNRINETKEDKLNDINYLFYSHLYLPTPRLEALFTKKINNNLQFILSGIMTPYESGKSHSYFLIQHEVKKWCTEYSFTSDDKLLGIRTLYKITEGSSRTNHNPFWSLGGEIYFSAAKKIGGVSFGLRRFGLFPSPADMTLTINPVMGHLTLAYTNMINPQLIGSTRYYFNTHSLESDYALGLEWRNKEEGMIKTKYSLSKGFSVLFSGKYRQLHYTLGLNIASPTNSNNTNQLNSHTMLKSMGIQLQYFSD